MKLNRKLRQQSWLEVKRFAQDDSLWMLTTALLLSIFNFHERSELTSILTSILTSESSVTIYYLPYKDMNKRAKAQIILVFRMLIRNFASKIN